MKHFGKRLALVAAAAAATCLLSVPATSADAHPRPTTYVLHGDPGDPQGSKFEGIGVDRAQRTFYVSETTGGEIHRGDVRSGRTKVWLPEGADGRATARGITVDRHGRVYIAGGPNSTQSGGPDLWVYAPDGHLLAALRVGVTRSLPQRRGDRAGRCGVLHQLQRPAGLPGRPGARPLAGQHLGRRHRHHPDPDRLQPGRDRRLARPARAGRRPGQHRSAVAFRPPHPAPSRPSTSAPRTC